MYKNYIITKEGSIISKKTGKQLYVHVNKKGYNFVRLKADGNGRTMLVHRIIAYLFLPNPDNLPEVNHKDGNKSNNNHWNLEWCSRKHNVEHAVASGLHHKGEGSGNSKLTNDQAEQLRGLYRTGWKQDDLAKRFGITQPRVSDIVNNKSY